MYVWEIPNRGACIILQLNSLAPCLHFTALTDGDLDLGIIILFADDTELVKINLRNYLIVFRMS